MERQIALMGTLSPDALSRLVSRTEPNPVAAFDLRKAALAQARILADGLKGGVQSLAGQVSTARALRAEGLSGLQYLREARSNKEAPLLCLVPAGVPART